MLEADLPIDPPVALGSMQAYALCSLRNYVVMAIHAGCSEDQVFGVVVDGIDRATTLGASGGIPAPGTALTRVGCGAE